MSICLKRLGLIFISGAFIAGLIMVGMYWEQLSAFAEASQAAGNGLVYNGGPASVLCSFPNPTQNNLGYLFMIEFFVDSYIVRESRSDYQTMSLIAN